VLAAGLAQPVGDARVARAGLKRRLKERVERVMGDQSTTSANCLWIMGKYRTRIGKVKKAEGEFKRPHAMQRNKERAKETRRK
jgi:hypothetical protein